MALHSLSHLLRILSSEDFEVWQFRKHVRTYFRAKAYFNVEGA